jgi:acetolactate synthase-1/2/3 large subunit
VRYLRDEPADVVVVIGSAMSEWSTLSWSEALCPVECLAQVDANADVIGRAYGVGEPIVADAGAFLERLVESAVDATPASTERRRGVVEELRRTAIAYAKPDLDISDATPIKPQRVVKEVSDWLRGERKLLFIDAGNAIGWFSQRAKMQPPAELLLPYGLACMGWANAAVIGAKIACPQVPCATLTGDGGFLMNAVEIATAARYRVGAIWIVANDNYFNTVRLGMHSSFRCDYAGQEDFSLGDPDLVKVAEGLGADARRVTRPSDLRGALDDAERAARDGRPQLLCVPIDPDEVPPFQERFDSIGDNAARMLG